MPEVVVYALEGRSVDQKRGLVKDITSALVKNYGVPADAVVVTVVETAKHDKAEGGVLFSEMSVPPQAKASSTTYIRRPRARGRQCGGRPCLRAPSGRA